MAKLTLDVNALAVETFATDRGAAKGSGTVMGHQGAFLLDSFGLYCSTNYTCPVTR
ncbi:MAG TPA: hypothetical protein VF092_03490 [Longimicrobium sp.]